MKSPHEVNCDKFTYNRHLKANSVNSDYEGDEICEAAQFLAWVDDEGGLESFVRGKGSAAFPEALRSHALDLEAALDRLQDALVQWAAARGVQA